MNAIIDASWHPLADGNPPAWAVGWGQHRRYGVFVEFGIGDIVQRLRWIPPGQFLMGSPADEPGRFEDEGPQHQVTIAEGFWLMDTPCTQPNFANFPAARGNIFNFGLKKGQKCRGPGCGLHL